MTSTRDTFINRILARIHLWFIQRCKHDDATYDLTEGSNNVPVTWCRECGAVKAHPNQDWRTPRPDWSLDPL
jgi:hypothetical protein